MRQLWSYEDCVEHLTSNSQVRAWALNIIKNDSPVVHTGNRQINGDLDEHLASAAVRYLASHKATEFAPAILDCLFQVKEISEGIAPRLWVICFTSLRLIKSSISCLTAPTRTRSWVFFTTLGKSIAKIAIRLSKQLFTMSRTIIGLMPQRCTYLNTATWKMCRWFLSGLWARLAGQISAP